MRTLLGLTLAVLPIAGCGGGAGDDGGGGGGGPPGLVLAELVNSGLAVATTADDIATLDPHVLVSVSETETNLDLNGDGDMNDQVVHLVDTTNDTSVNIGFATVGMLLASDDRFAFLASEAGQGNTDLNGDSDTADAVWYLLDPTQPVLPGANPVSTGLATAPNGKPAAATEGGFLFVQTEGAAGGDLNGDGDSADDVLTLFATATTFSLTQGRVHAPGTPFVSRNGRILFAAIEAGSLTDLNGDGDTTDTVLIAANFKVNPGFIPIGGPGVARSIGGNPYALTDGEAVYMVEENSAQTPVGFDFNGDGDTLDHIIAVFGLSTRVENMTVPPRAVHPAAGIGTSADRAAFAAEEFGQGPAPGTDLNNDFDFVDIVLAWIDTANLPQTANFPVDGSGNRLSVVALPPRMALGRGIVVVNEAGSGVAGGTDFNGDGDRQDGVAFSIDVMNAPGSAVSLNFAVATVQLTGTDALLGVSEAAQNVDMNGDADKDDVVLRYVNLGDSSPTSRGLGTVSNATAFFRFSATEVRIAAILDEGQSPNFDNLNGDGDTDDRGLILLGTDPALSPPGSIAQTPFFGGTASFSLAPPLRIGDRIFGFYSAEPMQDADLNGDGDMLDTVFQYVRYNLP